MAMCAGQGRVEWFLLLAVVVMISSIRSVDSKKVNWTKSNLDIAFAVDESISMKDGEFFNHTMNDMQQWFTSFFRNGTNDTRVAIIGCQANYTWKGGDGLLQVSLHLKNGTNKEIVQKHIQHIVNRKSKTGDNRYECFKKVFDEIFTEINGDRNESDDVVFYVSDCDHMSWDQGKNVHNDTQLLKKLQNGKTFIICIKTKDGKGVYSEYWKEKYHAANQIPMLWEDVALDWVNNDTTRLIIYQNVSQLIKATEARLLQTEIDVTPCEYIEMSTDGCAWNKEAKACENAIIVDIQTKAAPVLTGVNECPSNSTVPCKPSECECSRFSMVFGDCSVTCGDGNKIGRRNITLAKKFTNFESRADPSCKEVETRPCAMEPCPTVITESTSAAAIELNTESNNPSQTIIIAVVCSIVGLLLLIITLIIASRKKAKKAVVAKKTGKSVDGAKLAANMVDEGFSDKAKAEKLKGIKADMSIMPKPSKSMSETAKGDSSKMAKANKSVAKEGKSMTKGDKSVAKAAKEKKTAKSSKK